MRSIRAPLAGLVAVATVAAGTPWRTAAAQPLDPYAPPPAPAPTPAPAPAPTPVAPAPTPPPVDDAQRDLDEAVAIALIDRARELFDNRAYADAKQLLVEAMLRAPGGVAAATAKDLLRATNQRLGIHPDDGDPAVTGGPGATAAPGADDPVDPYGAGAPSAPAGDNEGVEPAFGDVTVGGGAADGGGRGTLPMTVHGSLFGGLLFLSFMDLDSDEVDRDNQADAVAPVAAGMVLGALGGYGLARLTKTTHATGLAVGAGATWGATTFGLIADLGSVDESSNNTIVRTAAVGGVLGGIAGAVVGRGLHLTSADVVLVDSLATMGVVGGLTLGLAMAPAESEAYSLNAAIGTGAGVVIGLIAASRTEVPTARMLRVDLAAAVGAGAPWLIYALVEDGTTNNDEQAIGFLSAAGMVAGTWLGFRWTRGLAGGPVDGVDDAPVALVRRSSLGTWSMGAPALRAPSLPALAPASRGLAADLVGVRF